MISLPQELDQFLTAYLAVTPDLAGAVRSFAASEGVVATRSLLDAIRGVLVEDYPDAALRVEIEQRANTSLRRDSRLYLRDLFSALARESQFPDFRPYDAFISYSSNDHDLAARLAASLRANGYAVWLDRDEILVGHNILDEVYRGILQSRFLIVLLTKNSLRSMWVKEELTAARLGEIESARVIVLPVKCERDIEIPQTLRGKRYADLSTSSFEDGAAEIMRAMDLSRAGVSVSPVATERAETFQELNAWYQALIPDATQAGYRSTDGGYKDVVIGPPDSSISNHDERQLADLLTRTRVRLKGWGGAPFPYEQHPKATSRHLPDGLQIIDTHTWVFSAWNFTYLRFTERLRLFQRSSLLEDGSLTEDGHTSLKGFLNVVWVLKDVCTALLFARNLLREIPGLRRVQVKHVLGGMNGRQLVVRGFARAPLMGDYICHANEITEDAVVGPTSDLEQEALRIVANIFWLFQWERFDPASVRGDIRSFLKGEFPPNW